jgi:hypothetical protein
MTFPQIFFRKTKQEPKPKPAPESPRPGAADGGGEAIKSALAGHLADVPEILRGNSFECFKGII